MDFSIPSFDPQRFKQICEVLADTSSGLTGWEIQQLLNQLGFEDPSPQAPNKRARLLDALLLEQQGSGSGYPVVFFIEEAMKPVNYTRRREQFETRRHDLNSVLAFAGYTLGLDGTIHPRALQ